MCLTDKDLFLSHNIFHLTVLFLVNFTIIKNNILRSSIGSTKKHHWMFDSRKRKKTWNGVVAERFERRSGILQSMSGISFAPLLFGVPDRVFIYELLDAFGLFFRRSYFSWRQNTYELAHSYSEKRKLLRYFKNFCEINNTFS